MYLHVIHKLVVHVSTRSFAPGAALPAERVQPPEAGAAGRAPRARARHAPAGRAGLLARRHRARRQAARAQVSGSLRP